MIDKLVVTADEANLEALARQFGDTENTYQLHNIYSKCQKIICKSTGAHKLTIYSQPRVSQASHTRIELNPSKLGLSYMGLMKALMSGLDTDEAKIQRIDHAADIQMSVEEALNTVRFKYKRNLSSYSDYQKGCLTGFYIGSRFEQVVIYDKRYELKGGRFKAHTSGLDTSQLTRFEVRQKHQKLPIRVLSDLPRLAMIDPFESLETYQLEPLMSGFIALGWKGLHNTYLQLNKSNNFKRNYRQYLVQSDLKQRITNTYWLNMGQFLMEGK